MFMPGIYFNPAGSHTNGIVTVNLGTRLLWELYDNLDANEKLKTTVYDLNSFYKLNQICNELDKWQMSKMFPK